MGFSHIRTQSNYDGSDERYTPPEAVYPLLKYLDKSKLYWLPCDTEQSYFVKIMRAEGFSITHSHISQGGGISIITSHRTLMPSSLIHPFQTKPYLSSVA